MNLRRVLLGVTFGLVLAASAANAEVFVRVRPPALIREERIVRPGPNYAWVPGYHRWDGNAYAWERGRWMVPERRGAVWVPHRWVRRRGGWVFVEGRWR